MLPHSRAAFTVPALSPEAREPGSGIGRRGFAKGQSLLA
jgi:hypothetical protein